MSSLRPFQQLPFNELPQRPRLRHIYFETEALDIEVPSDVMGPTQTHVRRFGSGPPLLLVHGLNTSSYSWRYVFEPLGQHFTCYAPDLPAAGSSAAPLEPEYSARNLGRWLIDVQRALGIYGCRVIGNSMGGYLAMEMALHDPKSVFRLVNLHSPGVPELRLYALNGLLRLGFMRAFLRWLIRRDPPRFCHTNAHYYDESLKSLEEAEQYATPLRSYAGQQGLAKYLGETMNPWAMRDFLGRLPQLSVPTLLVYARTDPMVSPRIGEVLAARAPQAELVWLSEASHFAHVDATERFIGAVMDFLISA